MQSGMLWFDPERGRDLAQKVRAACAYYERKYGRRPNQCLVHPRMLEHGELELDGVRVCAGAQMQPNHLWVGWNEQLKQSGRPAKKPAVAGPDRGPADPV